MLLHLDQRLTRYRRHSSGICFSSYRGYKYILASHFLSILGELELEICDTYVQREIHILWYIQISGARCLRPHRVTEIEHSAYHSLSARKYFNFCWATLLWSSCHPSASVHLSLSVHALKSSILRSVQQRQQLRIMPMSWMRATPPATATR